MLHFYLARMYHLTKTSELRKAVFASIVAMHQIATQIDRYTKNSHCIGSTQEIGFLNCDDVQNTNNLDTFFSIFAENGSLLRMNYTLSLTKISQVKSSRTPHSWFRVNVLFTTSGFLYVKGKYSLVCIFSRCKYIYIGWASW